MFCWWWRVWNRGEEVAAATVNDFCAVKQRKGTSALLLLEDMSGNECLLQVQKPCILHFISNCDLFTDSPSYNVMYNLYFLG
jgi:hypothetical protein